MHLLRFKLENQKTEEETIESVIALLPIVNRQNILDNIIN